MTLLDDKAVLVSGGSQGVGAAIARAAVREGAAVTVTERGTGRGDVLVAELTAAGGTALFVRADLADAERAKSSVPRVAEAYGRVDCLVNSAGPTSRGTLLDTTPNCPTGTRTCSAARTGPLPARPAHRTAAHRTAPHRTAPQPRSKTLMRIGILGLGRIGAFHAETLSGLDAVDSLIVADPVADAAKTAAGRFGAEVADSPEAVLAAGVDGVVIAAATDAHPDLILAAVEAGVPVFCEKPVARTMTEGVEVLKALAGHDVPVQIGYNRRFDAGFAAARAAVRAGELGRLHTVRSTTLDPAPPPAAYVAASGGIFRDCSVHDFDIIRWVTGREVGEVYAAGGNRGADFIREAGDADTTGAVLTLDDGTIAVVSNSRHNARGYDVRMEIHGFADSIAVGLEDKLPLRSVEPGATFPAGAPHDFFMDRFAAAYRAELTAFTEVVAGGRPSPCTIEDALEAGWIAEACTLSLHEHRPVTIAEVRRG